MTVPTPRTWTSQCQANTRTSRVPNKAEQAGDRWTDTEGRGQAAQGL